MTQGNTQNTATLNVELDVNSYLPAGGTRLNGSFIISPKGFSGVASVYLPRCRAAVIDVSGSMDEKGKIGQAKAATRAFVQELPESDYFVIVKYHSHAEFVFPRARNTTEIVKPVLATAENKRLALAAIDELKVEDNTYPSYGIDKAFQSFLLSPCDEATVCFLTDGQFNSNDSPKLEEVLKAIEAKRKEGRSFKISPRGIGTDFMVGELRQMADRTLGSAPKVVANPSDLKADFVEWMTKAREATLSNVRIKLWYPGQVKLVELKRLAPSIIDLLHDVTTEADGNTHTVALGSFPTSEESEYFFCLELTPKAAGGRPIRAGKLKVAYQFGPEQFEVPGTGLDQWYFIEAQWTEDAGLSARIPMGVARAKGSIELATAIQEGVKALAAGNEDEATRKLGRAVQLAQKTGDDEMTARLKKIVDVEDAEAGTVKIKAKAADSKAAAMDLDAASSTRKVQRKSST